MHLGCKAHVIPAKAGIQCSAKAGVQCSAKAGIQCSNLPSIFRLPAFAGMMDVTGVVGVCPVCYTNNSCLRPIYKGYSPETVKLFTGIKRLLHIFPMTERILKKMPWENKI